MKKNRITILVALILILVTAGLFITNSYTTLRSEVSKFAVDDTSNITKIFLADKKNKQVLLERGKDGIWMVDGKFNAQPAKVESFLKTLSDIQVRNPVPLKARDNVITRMSVIAKKIEIYQVVPRVNLFGKVKLFPHEKNTRTYYVGDVTQDNQGTFMLMEGSEEPYVVHLPGFRGFVSSRYSTNPDDWRDFTVFRTPIGEIRSVQVEFPAKPEESYKFELDDNKNIHLRELSNSMTAPDFDTIRALNFLTAFQDVRFEALLENMLEKSFIDSVVASTPKILITVTDRRGVQNHVKIFHKKGFADLYMEDGFTIEPMDLDRGYALVNNGEDFVLIQYYTFDRITRQLSYFTRQQ
jgi:hypothetical protein